MNYLTCEVSLSYPHCRPHFLLTLLHASLDLFSKYFFDFYLEMIERLFVYMHTYIYITSLLLEMIDGLFVACVSLCSPFPLSLCMKTLFREDGSVEMVGLISLILASLSLYIYIYVWSSALSLGRTVTGSALSNNW